MHQTPLKETCSDEKFNIVGLIVHTNPAQQEEIELTLSQINGVEVCAAEGGKIVLTIDEQTCDQLLVDTITHLNNIPGVLSTSIAYHHFEGELADQEKKR